MWSSASVKQLLQNRYKPNDRKQNEPFVLHGLNWISESWLARVGPFYAQICHHGNRVSIPEERRKRVPSGKSVRLRRKRAGGSWSEWQNAESRLLRWRREGREKQTVWRFQAQTILNQTSFSFKPLLIISTDKGKHGELNSELPQQTPFSVRLNISAARTCDSWSRLLRTELTDRSYVQDPQDVSGRSDSAFSSSFGSRHWRKQDETHPEEQSRNFSTFKKKHVFINCLYFWVTSSCWIGFELRWIWFNPRKHFFVWRRFNKPTNLFRNYFIFNS